MNIHAARGVAIREFSTKTSHGFADYQPYVGGKTAEICPATANSNAVAERHSAYVTNLI